MVRRPVIIGDTWFNSKPLTPADIEKKVVLVDFWTYSCVNCLRTLPYLQEWWKKYKASEFILIGVHTPEFEFEKDHRNVEQALKELGVSWPVVLDNEYTNWNNFANRYWPAKYVSNRDGYIVYTHFGEGAYKETELIIQQLLKESGQTVFSEIDQDEHIHGSVCFIPTPELYCGYKRGYLAFPQEYKKEQELFYKEPKEIPIGTIVLSGDFFAAAEFIEPRGENSTLLLRFHATEVNLVATPIRGMGEAEINFNTLPLSDDIRGKDVLASSEVQIQKSTMLNLVKSTTPLEGILSIRMKQPFRAYAFTFSGCP